MKQNKLDVSKLAEALQGTCESLDNVLEKRFDTTYDDVTRKQLVELDGKVLCCVACGWWFETHEMELDKSETGFLCSDCRAT